MSNSLTTATTLIYSGTAQALSYAGMHTPWLGLTKKNTDHIFNN